MVFPGASTPAAAIVALEGDKTGTIVKEPEAETVPTVAVT
jgi:hypothetical protein